IDLRRNEPAFHRRHFFDGRPENGGNIKDVSWIKSDGSEFGEEDWDDPGLRTIGMHLAGDEPGIGHQPSPVLLVFHAGEDEIEFMLPSMKRKGSRDEWRA